MDDVGHVQILGDSSEFDLHVMVVVGVAADVKVARDFLHREGAD